jgi:hypothetical protein
MPESLDVGLIHVVVVELGGGPIRVVVVELGDGFDVVCVVDVGRTPDKVGYDKPLLLVFRVFRLALYKAWFTQTCKKTDPLFFCIRPSFFGPMLLKNIGRTDRNFPIFPSDFFHSIGPKKVGRMQQNRMDAKNGSIFCGTTSIDRPPPIYRPTIYQPDLT